MEIWNDYSNSGCRIWGRECAEFMKTKNIQPIMMFFLPKFDGSYTESAYRIPIVAFGEGKGGANATPKKKQP